MPDAQEIHKPVYRSPLIIISAPPLISVAAPQIIVIRNNQIIELLAAAP